MFTSVNEQTAKRIRGRVKLLRRLAMNNLRTLDLADSTFDDGELERLSEMDDEALDNMAAYPNSEENRVWKTYVRQGYEIIDGIIDARRDFDRNAPEHVEEMKSLERRISMFRKGLQKKIQRQHHYQIVMDNFDVALVTATAEKPLTYEEAKRFTELTSCKPVGDKSSGERIYLM